MRLPLREIGVGGLRVLPRDAIALGRAGFAVGVAARSVDVLREVAARIAAGGAPAEVFRVDVADRASTASSGCARPR